LEINQTHTQSQVRDHALLENYTQNESNFEWHERYVPVIEGSYSNCDFDGRHFA